MEVVQRRRRRRPSVSVFRKDCPSRVPAHPLCFQPHRAKSRTCFEGPFGEVCRKTGAMADAMPFRFSTKYQDSEPDLLYYGCRYYSADSGRWISRDPSEEDGGLNLYGLLSNRPIGDVDLLGLMKWLELVAIQEELDAQVRIHKCCCDIVTAITKADISGTASGSQVTDTLKLTKIGCVDTITEAQYFWWDCATAQGEYDADPSPTKPKNLQAWQDYGWHAGANPQTQSHTGSLIGGMSDNSHWNWQGALLYIFCGKDQHYHAKMVISDPLEWTWGYRGWKNPHYGGGSRKQ